MFGQLLELESWAPVVRRGLIALAVLLLAPAAGLAFGMLAVMLAPVAVVGIPFMLPAFFGSAVTEHDAAVRDSLRPPARAATALAS